MFVSLSLVGCSTTGGPASRIALPAVAPPEAAAAGRGIPDVALTGLPAQRAVDPSPAVPAGVVARLVAGLQGLSFEDFLQASFYALLSRSPEHVTETGLADQLGMRHHHLDDLSTAYTSQTSALRRAILDLLRGYDRGAMTPEDRLTYDIYRWYLEDGIRDEVFAGREHPFGDDVWDYHARLVRLLETLQPMDTPVDAEDYIARLGQVDDQVRDLVAGLQQREAAGIAPPQFVVVRARDRLLHYLGATARDPAAISAESLSVYGVFRTKLDKIDPLRPEQRAALRQQALEAVRTSFVPAYLSLVAYLDHLAGVASDAVGVWRQPDGAAYYATCLRSQTTTALTPEAVHALGLREVDRVHTELRETLAAMGYPQDLDLAAAVARVVEDAGSLPTDTELGRDAVLAAWRALADKVDRHIGPAFDTRPRAQVEVAFGLGREHYVPAPADGSAPARMMVALSELGQPRYIMPTIAAHEAVGHHYQLGLTHEMRLPELRYQIGYVASTEGWALYAERLAAERGLYDDDPHGKVGHLLAQLLRAARLVVDTGIHAQGWTRAEARRYMEQTAAGAPGIFDQEIDEIILQPGRATAGEVGMLRLLAMRARAQAALGDAFDLKAFHAAVIGHGIMPLEVLDTVVDDYIARETVRAVAAPRAGDRQPAPHGDERPAGQADP